MLSKKRIHKLKTDYLVVWAGAMGIAFVDEMLHLTKDTTFVIVDKNANAWWHWNHAYRFVTLHQPSLFYGVNSKKFNTKENMYATKSEILYYYECVMRNFIRTNRVTFLNQCEYQWDGKVQSLISADLSYDIKISNKLVNATYMEADIPVLHKLNFDVEAWVEIVPVNQISELRKPYDRYTIIWAGKTWIDAILYILKQGVHPDHIHWIISSDSWLLCQKTILPQNLLKKQKRILKIVADSRSVDEVIWSMKKAWMFYQIDTGTNPTKFRCATVSQNDLTKLRSIKNVHRKWHIRKIGIDSMVMDGWNIDTVWNTLYVDCTARWLGKRNEATNVFSGKQITLQSIFICLQVLSASIIAKIETLSCSEEEKNSMCQPVAHPNTPLEYLQSMKPSLENNVLWMRKFPFWCCKTRLFMTYHVKTLPFLWCLITYFRNQIPKTIKSIDKILQNKDQNL